MPIVNRIAEYQDELTAWRRHLHERPELGFEERETAAFVAEKLESFGCDEVHTGIGRTGVVAVIKGGRGGRGIGLRADMDALPIQEAGGVAWASRHPGRMHACGHDGHTTMLLGAARYLAETRNFDGTAYLIFQPAEEGGGGGRVMVDDGLFERFPAEQVFGLHNWPYAPTGTFAMCEGPAMAASDELTIELDRHRLPCRHAASGPRPDRGGLAADPGAAAAGGARDRPDRQRGHLDHQGRRRRRLQCGARSRWCSGAPSAPSARPRASA